MREYQRVIVKDILSNNYKHLLLIAPRRSGKSVLATYLVNALVNSYYLKESMPINATIFAPQQKQCREIYVDNILQDGTKLLNICNARFLKSHLSLEYSFGSKIKLAGSDQIDTKMGAGNKIVVLDEYALSDSGLEAFQRLYPMVLNTDGHMIVMSTPRGKNHLYELYEQVKNNKDWLVVHSDVFAWDLMTQEEYDAIPMHENYKRQEFLCSWDSPFENAIYLEPAVKDVAINYNAKTFVALDLGMKDATAVIFAQVFNNEINIIHSFESVNTSLTDIETQISQYLKENRLFLSAMFVPHDTNQRDYITGKSRFDYLLNAGYKVELVTKCGIIDGIEMVRNKWHDIYFNTNTLAIERVKAYVIDQKTKKPKHDDASHMSDALRYLIVGLDTHQNSNVQTNNKYELMYRTNVHQRRI